MNLLYIKICFIVHREYSRVSLYVVFSKFQEIDRYYNFQSCLKDTGIEGKSISCLRSLGLLSTEPECIPTQTPGHHLVSLLLSPAGLHFELVCK